MPLQPWLPLAIVAPRSRLLWIVSPGRRTITVHRSFSDIVVLTEDDTLDGGDVLPGFTCRVGDLFQPFFTGNPPN